MSLDLGELVARARLDTTLFDRSAMRVMRVMADFGGRAEQSSSRVRILDRSLVGAAGAFPQS